MMTVPLELPMRANEAAALADLILQMGERQVLTTEVRNRLLSRIPSLGLESLKPYMGSLVKDPTHSSTYYLAVDAVSMAGVAKPFLLHMALSSAPASAHFMKPILVGRMRPGGGREIVVNAIPFGPEDIQTVRTFGEQVDRGFLPRPQGMLSSISIAVADPAHDLPKAFEAYQMANQELRMNLAAPVRVELADQFEASYAVGLWGAIRCGWREGYTIEAALEVSGNDDANLERVKQSIRMASIYTKFSLDVSSLVNDASEGQFETLFDAVERSWILEEFAREFPVGGDVGVVRFTQEEIQLAAVRFAKLLSTTEKLYDEIRREKARSATGRTFDFELKLGSDAVTVTPREMVFILHWLKSQRRAAQFIAPHLHEGTYVASVSEFAAVARHFQATLTLTPGDDLEPEVVEQVARACGGRVNWRLTKPHDAAYLQALASSLRG